MVSAIGIIGDGVRVSVVLVSSTKVHGVTGNSSNLLLAAYGQGEGIFADTALVGQVKIIADHVGDLAGLDLVEDLIPDGSKGRLCCILRDDSAAVTLFDQIVHQLFAVGITAPMVFIQLECVRVIHLSRQRTVYRRRFVNSDLRTNQVVGFVAVVLFFSAIVADKAIYLCGVRLVILIGLKIFRGVHILFLGSGITSGQRIKHISRNLIPLTILHVVHRVSILDVIFTISTVLVPHAHRIARILICPQICDSIADGDQVGLIAYDLLRRQRILCGQETGVEVGTAALWLTQQRLCICFSIYGGPGAGIRIGPIVDDTGFNVGVLLACQLLQHIGCRITDINAGGIIQDKQDRHVFHGLLCTDG